MSDPVPMLSTKLPINKTLKHKDAFYSLCLAPLEYITKSLRTGDAWELTELTPFINRCRALVAAYDKRMEELR